MSAGTPVVQSIVHTRVANDSFGQVDLSQGWHDNAESEMSVKMTDEADFAMRLRWPIEDVVAFAKRYALTHGLLCLVPDHADQATFVPFSLYPSPYAYSHFKFIWSIQTAYNRLYNRLSLDDATLEAALASVIPMDEFVARLWQMHHTSPRRQSIQLDIYRSESPLHLDPVLYPPLS